MRRLALVALALLALAACGGGGGTTTAEENGGTDGEAVSEAEYIQQAEEICRNAIDEIEDIPEPETQAEVADFFNEVLPIAEESVEELRALEPPEGLEEQVDEWNELNEEYIQVARDFADALDEGDDEQVAELSDDLEENDRETDELAEEIGVDACAEDAAE